MAFESARAIRHQEADLIWLGVTAKYMPATRPSPFFWRNNDPPKFWMAQIIRDRTTLYNAARVFSVVAAARAFVRAAGPSGEVVAEFLGFARRESPRPSLSLLLLEFSRPVLACSGCV